MQRAVPSTLSLERRCRDFLNFLVVSGERVKDMSLYDGM